ncbi:inhibitor of Bruton tyrosine kinase [Lepeophtheirus salmonis]|uniref:inhibitor of Bruton tyrosine kinase n=1 Tax=Lepeophtheirus salmonis TaxID=72036 RepID=UPI003AF333BF
MLESWDDEFFIEICRNGDEEDILSYVSNVKAPFVGYTDEFHRNLLHIAATYDRAQTCMSLIERISPEEVDFYKWTPLHRAIYYGNFKTALLFQDKIFYNKMDVEGYTPLDLLALDNLDTSPSVPTIFAWGTNTNYSLGLGAKESILYPEVHEFYRKNCIHPKKVQINMFHSGVLDSNGTLFLAGYGSNGRLGNGLKCTPLLEPKNIFSPNTKVIDFALGREHSIFLIKNESKNSIYVTGSNLHKQLGLKGDSIYSPKLLLNTCDEIIIGVGSSNYYSCYWSSGVIYAWGLNLGQMGHILDEDNPYSESPRLVCTLTNEHKIRQVYTSDASIVILTQNDKLLIFRETNIKRLQLPCKSVKKVQIIEDYCIKTQRYIIPLKIYTLSNQGILYSWSAESGLFRCQPLIEDRNVLVYDFFVSQENIYIVSSDTHFLYKSFCDIYTTPLKKIKKELYRRFKVSRIPKANKVLSIMGDIKGLNFILSCSCSNQEKKEKINNDIHLSDQIKLEDHKILQDGSIIVGSKTFNIHTALLYRENPTLANKILDSPNSIYKLEELNDQNDAENLFEKMIELCYEGVPSKQSQNVKFRSLAKKCGFFEKKTKKNRLLSNKYCRVNPDVYLISSDGTEFPVHRIILCQKSEYFSAMFRDGVWSESKKNAKVKLQVDSKSLKVIIEYIYSGTILNQFLEEAEDIANVLCFSNQYFIARLDLICEKLMKRSLNLRNAIKIFKFALEFSLQGLYESAMYFICCNMGYFYENEWLQSLDEDNIEALCIYYRTSYFSKERQISRNIKSFPGTISYDDTWNYYQQFIFDLPINASLDNNSSTGKSQKARISSLNKKSSRKKKKQIALDSKLVKDDFKSHKISVDYEEQGVNNIGLAETENLDIQKQKESQIQNPSLVDDQLTSLAAYEVVDDFTSGSYHSPLDFSPNKSIPKSKITRVPKSSWKHLNSATKLGTEWSGWKTFEDNDELVFEILNYPEECSPLKQPPKLKTPRISKSSWKQLSFTKDEESESNICPWSQSPPDEVKLENISFENILNDEKQKTADTERIKSKPFSIIQIEERAMNDLLVYYQAESKSDETISVHRCIDTTKLSLVPAWYT